MASNSTKAIDRVAAEYSDGLLVGYCNAVVLAMFGLPLVYGSRKRYLTAGAGLRRYLHAHPILACIALVAELYRCSLKLHLIEGAKVSELPMLFLCY